MPRPRSPQTQAAIDDIKAGMSQSEASRKHGVDQGLISRMLKPKERTVTLRLTRRELISLSSGDCWNISLMDKLNAAIAKLTAPSN